MMMSRLLEELNRRIAEGCDPILVDCATAERACYLVRRGKLDDAKMAATLLRKKYTDNPNILVSTWICLLDGLLIHFSNMGESARDRINRAYALSNAGGLKQMQALSAAWLAHMDYLSLDINKMSTYASIALTLAEEKNFGAKARASLVIAQAYHFSRRLDLAIPWYTKARNAASEEGDDATISALMHNMAWLRAVNKFQAEDRGMDIPSDGEHALQSANSLIQFDTLKGSTSLGALGYLLNAQLLTSGSQYKEALEIFDSYLDRGIREGIGKLCAGLLADKALCQHRTGKFSEARSTLECAEASLDPKGQHDDRAVAHSRLARMYRETGNIEAATKHSTLASQAWTAHEEMQMSIIDTLAANATLALCPQTSS